MDFKKYLLVFIVLLFSCALPFHLNAEEYRTDHTPWSGYWWPFNYCGLATGTGYYYSPSPLEKYEQYSLGYYPAVLTSWYKKTYCGQDYPSWYGHCGDWALAASWENYEILPSVVNNIIFRVGDKKGLLTLSHNNDVVIKGSGSDPSEFHFWLLQYIRDEKRAFVADMDGGEEIWNYPLYRYDMSSSVSGSTESVTVTVYAASDNVEPDYIGTKDRTYYLTYDLYLDGNNDITGGQWTGNSSGTGHPQNMHYCLSPATTASDLDYDMVVQIAKTRDDEYENLENSVTLSPGNYNLILLDADVYEFECYTGDTLAFDITVVEGGGDQAACVLTDRDGNEIKSLEATEDQAISFQVEADNPPYYLSVSKEDYDTPGIYNIVYDRFTDKSMTVPYTPTNGRWSGFSIVNPGQNSATLTMTGYTEEGKALQTLMGPLELAPGEKQKFLYSNLPRRIHEYSLFNSLRITGDDLLGVLNIIGDGSAAGAVTKSGYKGCNLILADTVMEMQSDASMFGSIINESNQDADVTVAMYTKDGLQVKTHDATLAPRQVFEFRSGIYPFTSVPEQGWMHITSESGVQALSGYQYIERDGTVEINQAVPLSSDVKIVPHIPRSDKWETNLVLINPWERSVNVVLHRVMAGIDTSKDVNVSIEPMARKTLDLGSLFATFADDAFYRSVLSVSSDRAVSGYYSYKGVSQADNVTIPLINTSDLSSTLLLPHNTQGRDWGTGIGLFNPSAEKVVIELQPYGDNGNVMQEMVETITLEPGEYKVISIAKRFGSQAGNITFLLFEESNANPIGGFYLLDSKSGGICGGNLQMLE